MTTTASTAALEYLDRGWAPIPVRPRAKKPYDDGWPDLRVTVNDVPQHFGHDDNVGVLLGEPSAGLIDVDLDCAEALALAPAFLLATKAVFGRKSKRGSSPYDPGTANVRHMAEAARNRPSFASSRA